MQVRNLSKPLYLDSQGGKFPYAEVAGAIESLGCKHVETTVSEGLSVSIDTYTVYDILYIIYMQSSYTENRPRSFLARFARNSSTSKSPGAHTVTY